MTSITGGRKLYDMTTPLIRSSTYAATQKKKGFNNPSKSTGGAIGFRVNRFLGVRQSTFKSSLPTTKRLQSTKVNGAYQFVLSARGRRPEDPKHPCRAGHVTRRRTKVERIMIRGRDRNPKE